MKKQIPKMPRLSKSLSLTFTERKELNRLIELAEKKIGTGGVKKP